MTSATLIGHIPRAWHIHVLLLYIHTVQYTVSAFFRRNVQNEPRKCKGIAAFIPDKLCIPFRLGSRQLLQCTTPQSDDPLLCLFRTSMETGD